MQSFRERTLDVTLRAHKLRVGTCALRELHLPVTLRKGELAADVQAAAYNGPVRVQLRATASPSGLQSKLELSFQHCDLRAATRDHGIAADVTGNAAGKAPLSGLFRSSADILTKMQGIWQCSMHEGYHQERDAQGKATGRKIRFNSITASGTVAMGNVHAKKIQLHGPDMELSGTAWFDLNKESLGGNLTARIPPLPDIPVTLTGTLQDPRVSVQAGKLITDGLGKLGSGLLDITGDLLDLTLGILR